MYISCSPSHSPSRSFLHSLCLCIPQCSIFLACLVRSFCTLLSGACTKVGTTIEFDVKEELSKTIKIFAKNLRIYYQNIIENQSKNDQKLVLEASREALGGARRPIPHQDGGTPFFGRGESVFWRPLGAVLGPSWSLLGPSWPSGRPLEPVLGPSWGLSWAVLACLGLSWAVLACLDLSWPDF